MRPTFGKWCEEQLDWMGVNEISGELERKKRKIDGRRAIPGFQRSGTVLEKGIELQGCGVEYVRRQRSSLNILFVSVNMKGFKLKGWRLSVITKLNVVSLHNFATFLFFSK
jgi:tmRNA-binding protein